MQKNKKTKLKICGILIILCGMIIVPAANASNISIEENQEESEIFAEGDYQQYKLLIIAPKYFQRELKRLVRHKENFGVSTRLVTLDEVYEEIHWEGRDNAEKVKYYIKNAYDYWGIDYVLLVGGKVGQLNKWHCPVRYINLDNGYEYQLLSDLYFADIYDSKGNFSTWDSDGDGRFMEWIQGQEPEDTNFDLYPDVAVGRLPCRNRFEVITMVRKIMRYEKTTYGKSWFNRIAAFGGDTYPECNNPKWVGYEGEHYADQVMENMTGFTQEKYYTSDGTLDHWSDILKALNKGWGFVYFNGHASPMIWTTHLPNSTIKFPGLTTMHMRLLRNGFKLPICVVGGCHNNQFDVSVFRYFNESGRAHVEYVPQCWSWMLTKKIGGGAIATIGITALGHTKEDKESFKGGSCELEVQFFYQYKQNNLDIIGDAWAASVSAYIDNYKLDWQSELTNDSWVDVQVPTTWILFGDPSLKIGGYAEPAVANME